MAYTFEQKSFNNLLNYAHFWKLDGLTKASYTSNSYQYQRFPFVKYLGNIVEETQNLMHLSVVYEIYNQTFEVGLEFQMLISQKFKLPENKFLLFFNNTLQMRIVLWNND